MTTKQGISIIIPAFNEQDRLAGTLKEIIIYIKKKKMPYEILIVNDGSTDRTFQVILSTMAKLKNVHVISYYRNRGKGYAIREGLIQATNKTCLVLDADHSVNINELALLSNEIIFKQPFVYGERVQKIPQPLHRIFVGKCFKALVWLTTGIWADTQSPFKLLNMPKEFYKTLTIDGFAYDVELFYKAKKKGIYPLPITVDYNNKDGSKVTFRKTLRMATDLVRIRWGKEKK